MALVTAPLLSMDASGTVGKTLTYAKWKGRPYCRQRVIPTNPQSAAQTGARSMFGFLAQQWTNLIAGEQDDYDDLAEAGQISAFNVYMAKNLARWQLNMGPSKNYPAEEAASPLTTTQVLTGAAGYINVNNTPSGATALWGFAIARSTAEITAPTWALVIAIVQGDGASAVDFVDSPLDAGTYHYRSAAFTDDGQLGTFCADDTAAAT